MKVVVGKLPASSIVRSGKVLLVAAILLGSGSGAAQQGSNPEPNTLAWYAQKAVEQGEHEVTFAAPLPSQISVKSLDAALNSFTVLIGTFTKREPVSDGPYSIVTLYRFQVIDNLSLHAHPVSGVSSKTFLPSPGDYVQVKVPGGSMELEGVRLTEASSFPLLQLSTKYLLFARFEADGSAATIQPGPAGVFEVDSASRLRPLAPGSRHAMAIDMQSYFEDKLELLKLYVQSRRDPVR